MYLYIGRLYLYHNKEGDKIDSTKDGIYIRFLGNEKELYKFSGGNRLGVVYLAQHQLQYLKGGV